MPSVDEIMDMLDWNNPPEVQEEGRRLSQTVKCIDAFLQPVHSRHGKNVWDNCAAILAGKTDQELKPYLPELLDWLQDMNWPGAYCIFNRLKKYEKRDELAHILNGCIHQAEESGEVNWKSILVELRYYGAPSRANAIDYLLSLFSNDMDLWISDLLDKDSEASQAIKSFERLMMYVSYCQRSEKSIVQFLLKRGYTAEEVRYLFEKYPVMAGISNVTELEAEEYLEQIFSSFLSETLDLVETIVEEKKHLYFGAITAGKRLQVYLDCQNANVSLREFLNKQGYSTSEVDDFYEEYRRGCLNCYYEEPEKLLYANGKLKVYEVEGVFVITILGLENGAVSSKGAEFTSDGKCVWTRDLQLMPLKDADDCIGKTLPQIQAEYGLPHVFLTISSQSSIPAYLADGGHLIYLFLTDDKVTEVKKKDLLRLP